MIGMKDQKAEPEPGDARDPTSAMAENGLGSSVALITDEAQRGVRGASIGHASGGAADRLRRGGRYH